MDGSDVLDRASWTILNASEMTTLPSSVILPTTLQNALGELVSSFWLAPAPLLSVFPAPMSPPSMPNSSATQSIYGTLRWTYRADRPLLTFNPASPIVLMANFDMLTLVSCILFGAMIALDLVLSTPRSVRTTTQQEAPKVQSVDSSTVSSMINLGTSHPSLFYSVFLTFCTIASWMWGALGDFGIWMLPWLTTILMPMSGLMSPRRLCQHSLSDVKDSGDTVPSSSSSQKTAVAGDSTNPPGSTESVSECAKSPEGNGSEKQTSSTGQDETDADEWEVVEETLVHVNCVGAIERDLIQPGRQVLIVDLDTETPLLQIGQAIFHGTYKQAIGTSLLFEKHAPTSVKDSSEKSLTESIGVFSSFPKPSSRPQFTYFGKTSKLLDLQRVFLKPKESGE
ncbi:General transcription factor 3C polypeptide 6 [Sparganum proliferum]